MSNQTKLYSDLVGLNEYLKKLIRDLNDISSMDLDKRTAGYYEGRKYQLNDCIVLVEDILDKNIVVEKVNDEKLVKEVITRFYK